MARIGNGMDHIAFQVLDGHPVDTWWRHLRNSYFREGSQNDGWDALKAWADLKGLAFSHEWDLDLEDYRIRFRPKAPAR